MIGFDSILNILEAANYKKKLPHAIIISGQSGIGKFTFTKKYILEKILETTKEEHPDLLIIKKNDDKKDINVDKIREISTFIKQTSVNSNKKIILIDSCENLNRSASNALLKILEEPNYNNYIFLTCNKISQIIPTIKSRCQIFKIKRPEFDDFCIIFNKKRPSFLPKITQDDLFIISEICDQSPGTAINHGEDLLELYKEFLTIISDPKLSEDFIKKISDKKFDITFLQRVITYLIYKILLNKPIIFSQENEAFNKIKNKNSLDNLILLQSDINKEFNLVSSLYLDKKLFVLNLINKLSN